MNTIRVFWKGKFEGKAVTIDATAFDPAIHRHEADGRWPAKAESPAIDYDALNAASLEEFAAATEAPKKAKPKASK